MAIILKKKEYPLIHKKEDTLFWTNVWKRSNFQESFIRDVVRVRMPNGDSFKGTICGVGSNNTIKVRTPTRVYANIPLGVALVERMGESEYKSRE